MEHPANNTRYEASPPWTLEQVYKTAQQDICAPPFAHIVNPPDGDNDVLHVIRQEILPSNGRIVPQQLLVIGTEHRTDFTHWTYEHFVGLMDRWERDTRDVNNRVIIREGDPSFWSGLGTAEEVDPAENISIASEGGLTMAFSRVHGIPIIAGDFCYYGDIAAQATLHPDRIREIIAYYTMRELPILERLQRMQDSVIPTERFLEQRTEILQRNMGKLALTTYVPSKLDFAYDTAVETIEEFFGRGPTLEDNDVYLKYTSAHIYDEAFQRQKVARIGVDRMRLSDAHLLLTIRHMLKLGKDVLTVFGNHHTLHLSHALAPDSCSKSLPLPPNRFYNIADKPGPERLKNFEGGILLYPPDEPRRISPGKLNVFRSPNRPENSHLSRYGHVWPNFSSRHTPLQEEGIRSMKALAQIEVANRFNCNDYLARICQAPIAWEGDLLDLFHILEYEGESVCKDPDLTGHNPPETSPTSMRHTTQMTPQLQTVLINAAQRLQDACGANKTAAQELPEWFATLYKTIDDTCPANFPLAHVIGRANMASKQIAGLCRLFRTNQDFVDTGLSLTEQCGYALSFLHFATQKDFWALRRLEQVVNPYTLPVYRSHDEPPYIAPSFARPNYVPPFLTAHFAQQDS